ncbi:MAG: hypothetical protein IKV66_13155 [Clostridia bacterium]|nr:hypothetical protein [Clostridia bacterium]
MKHLKLLPALLLIATLASCGGEAAGTTDTTPVDTAPATTEAVTEPGYPAPDTSSLDFGGDELRIFSVQWGNVSKYYFPEEETGDSVLDACYSRLRNVEEALNVKIAEPAWGADGQAHKDVMKTVQAGDDAYDMVFTHCIDGYSDYATNNAVYNLDALPYVNFEAPWWSKSMIDTFRIGTETYFGFGDIILNTPSSIFFNKEIAAEYDMPDHYQMVRDGKWTYDTFLKQARMVSIDVNGDGKMDYNDKTGYAGDLTESLGNIPFAVGIQLTKYTDDGLQLNFWSDKLLEVFNKTYDYFLDPSVSQGYFRHYVDVGQGFGDGLSLYTIANVSGMASLRDVDIEFGVVPMPKYDESQSEYRCYVWSPSVCVPTTILRPELVGAALEQFAYESVPVTNAYIEDLIRGKSTRDTETLEMLDIIYDSQVLDIGGTYLGFDSNFRKVFYCFYDLMSTKNDNVASFYEKSEKAILKVLDNLYTKVIENQSID